ncbi:hypothetical protein ACOME3_004343 [Neoechinorhynchus agilis]
MKFSKQKNLGKNHFGESNDRWNIQEAINSLQDALTACCEECLKVLDVNDKIKRIEVENETNKIDKDNLQSEIDEISGNIQQFDIEMAAVDTIIEEWEGKSVEYQNRFEDLKSDLKKMKTKVDYWKEKLGENSDKKVPYLRARIRSTVERMRKLEEKMKMIYK